MFQFSDFSSFSSIRQNLDMMEQNDLLIQIQWFKIYKKHLL